MCKYADIPCRAEGMTACLHFFYIVSCVVLYFSAACRQILFYPSVQLVVGFRWFRLAYSFSSRLFFAAGPPRTSMCILIPPHNIRLKSIVL